MSASIEPHGILTGMTTTWRKRDNGPMSKKPKTPAMEAADRLKGWARSTEITAPIRWGELEAHIAAAPVPPHHELESLFPPRTRSRLIYLLVVPQALLTAGSSLVGLGFVAAHVLGDVNAAVVGEIARLFVFVSIIITAVPVMMWMSTKRRGTYQAITSGGTALASAASFLMLGIDPQIGVWSSIRTMTAIAVVAGLGSFLFLRFCAKPGVSRTLRERWATPTLEDQWLQGQRAMVLEVLVKRGLVTTWDLSDLMELPRGAWQQLESQPDGHIVRHHR